MAIRNGNVDQHFGDLPCEPFARHHPFESYRRHIPRARKTIVLDRFQRLA